MIEISREFEIQAAHFLPHTPETHECHNMHGHTWIVELWLTGAIDPVKGWIIDYDELQSIWNEHVHAALDHSVLNDTIPNPTTEVIVQWLYAKLTPPLQKRNCWVTKIIVAEGRRNRTMLTVSRANGKT